MCDKFLFITSDSEGRREAVAMKYLQFTVFVVVCLSMVDIGTSIDCYQCNSYTQPQCDDEFGKDASFLLPCPGNVTMCRKIKQEVFYDDDWNVRYIRECASAGEVSDSCSDRTGTYQIKVKYCQCGETGCNAATNIKLNMIAVLLPVIAVLITAFKKL